MSIWLSASGANTASAPAKAWAARERSPANGTKRPRRFAPSDTDTASPLPSGVGSRSADTGAAATVRAPSQTAVRAAEGLALAASARIASERAPMSTASCPRSTAIAS
jgi:hypothetical protein